MLFEVVVLMRRATAVDLPEVFGAATEVDGAYLRVRWTKKGLSVLLIA